MINPWSAGLEPGAYEVGLRHNSPEAYFSGKFPEASMWLLSEDKVRAVNKKDLRIMRNEIYARYGLISSGAGKWTNTLELRNGTRDCIKM